MPGDHLVCVDLQRVFAEPGMPWQVPGFEQVVGPTTRLVEAFGDRVTFTRFVPQPPGPGTAWEEYYRLWPFAFEPGSGPMWELEPPFDELARRRVLDLGSFSKWGPELDAASGDADGLVICGVATECCVVSTALAAADAGRPVRIVADACAGSTEELHEATLAVLSSYAGHVRLTTVDDVIASLVAADPAR